MKQGENWAILGPNGSGKSTILRLISARISRATPTRSRSLAGKRAPGETLWEIKKRIGVVLLELQIQYRKKMSAYDVIASGFYDSIGLYQYPTKGQEVVVDGWIELLSIGDIARESFHRLSYGQKRMILLAGSWSNLPSADPRRTLPRPRSSEPEKDPEHRRDDRREKEDLTSCSSPTTKMRS